MNILRLLTFFLTAVLQETGTFSQILLRGPQNETVELGQSLILECQFSEGVYCKWTRGNIVLPEQISGRYRFVSDVTFGAFYQRSDCSIEIFPITESDLGQWTCGPNKFSSGVAWLSQSKDVIPKSKYNGKPFRMTPKGNKCRWPLNTTSGTFVSEYPAIMFKGNQIRRIIMSENDFLKDRMNLSCIQDSLSNQKSKMTWRWRNESFNGYIIRDYCNFKTILLWNESIAINGIGVWNTVKCIADFDRTAAIQIRIHHIYVPSAPNVSFWNSTANIIYVSIGATSLLLVGVGLGVLFNKMHQKQKRDTEVHNTNSLERTQDHLYDEVFSDGKYYQR